MSASKNKTVRDEDLVSLVESKKSVHYSVNQVSASDIQEFSTCPRRYYLYRVLRLGELSDRDPKKAANRGSLIHLLLEWDSLDQADELFARNKVSPDMAEELRNLVEHFQGSSFMEKVRQSRQLEKERAFYLQLSQEGQSPRYLKGYIDLMAWQGDGRLMIVDYKTGRGKAQQKDYQVQADCYGLAGLFMGAAKVEVVMLRPEVRDSGGEAESFHYHYDAERGTGLRRELVMLMERMEDAHDAPYDFVRSEYCKAFCSLYGSLCEGGSA